MTLGQFLVLHLMAGCGVAVAVYLTSPTASAGQRWFQVGTAVVFWPLYLPVLLSRPSTTPDGAVRAVSSDELAWTIAQVESELDEALQSLDGWAEGVLAREQARLHQLRRAWSAQAQRIGEMDRLLSRSEYIQDSPVIRHNLDRLHQVRAQAMQDLLETLAWVRELVSMLHVAKFTGAPASRAEELVAQIGDTLEEFSDVAGPNEHIQVPPGGGGSP
jgi:hypothetical protein